MKPVNLEGKMTETVQATDYPGKKEQFSATVWIVDYPSWAIMCRRFGSSREIQTVRSALL